MVVGRLVHQCIGAGQTLDTLELAQFQAASSLFDADVYDALALRSCVEGRKVPGGPSHEAVSSQIAYIQSFINGCSPSGQ